MRYATKKAKDRRVFRHTALKQNKLNLTNAAMRGGIRM